MPSRSRSAKNRPSHGLKAREARKILGSFRSAGLSRTWWKEFAKDVRRCLRCGGGLFWRRVVAERQSRFVCGDCRFIVYQNPKIVTATLPVWKGKIVLLRRAIVPALGRWTHPAGYMELGETIEAGAIRETWEEIRCRVRLSGAPRIYSYDDAAVVTVVFEAEVIGRGPRAGPESLEIGVFRPHEIPWRDLAFRSTFEALRDWVEGEPKR